MHIVCTHVCNVGSTLAGRIGCCSVQAKLAKLRRELLEPSSGSGGGGKGEGAQHPYA